MLGPCPTTEDYHRLAIWTNDEIRTNTLTWLDEVERIRKKSGNINGALSRKIRIRVEFAKSVVDTLANRAEDCGSSVFNKTRCEELERQIRSFERTVGELKTELKETEDRNRDLRAKLELRGENWLVVYIIRRRKEESQKQFLVPGGRSESL